MFLIPIEVLELRHTDIVKGTVDKVGEVPPLDPMTVLQLFVALGSAKEMRIQHQQVNSVCAVVNAKNSFTGAIAVSAHHYRRTKLLEVLLYQMRVLR